MPYYNYRGELMLESAAPKNNLYGTSAGGETLIAPEGPSAVFTNGGGDDTIIASNGDNIYYVRSTSDTVIVADGLTGVKTVVAFQHYELPEGVQNLTVNGGYNYAAGNSMDNLIKIGNDDQWMYGAGGNDVFVKGFGKGTFTVRSGEGNDVIYGWMSHDKVRLLDTEFATFAQIQAAMTQVGSDVVLHINDSETLTFRNTTVGSFTSQNFLMPLDRSLLGDQTFGDEFDTLNFYDFSSGTGQWQTNFGGNLKDPWAYSIVANGEQQVYTTPDYQGRGDGALGLNPFSIEDGVLSITAQKLTNQGSAASWGRSYSSGMINTYGTFEQQYGYFEIRAEKPEATGAWPAFWLLPNPYVGGIEADILEGLGHVPDYHFVRAYGEGTSSYDNTYIPNSEGFHTYGLLWTPETVTFYVDEIAVLHAPTPTNWNIPLSLIANLAVGGWGGTPDHGDFPASFNIDYIHVYELADGRSIVNYETPTAPAATIVTKDVLAAGALVSLTFASNGAALTSQSIVFRNGTPPASSLPPEGTAYIVFEQGGAVFGAFSKNGVLGEAVTLKAGTIGQFKDGTWLTDGRVAVAYMNTDNGVQNAYVIIMDPTTNTFTKQKLGEADGNVINLIPMADGDLAVSWENDGVVMARAFDRYAYDGKGWYGLPTEVPGHVVGANAEGHLVVSTPTGNVAFDVTPDPTNYQPPAQGNKVPSFGSLNSDPQGGDIAVSEAALANGSAPNAAALTQSGSFTIAIGDGMEDLYVEGRAVIVDGVFKGGSWVTSLGGTMTLTAYSSGVVSYTYTLGGVQTHEVGTLYDSFEVGINDKDGDAASGTLTVRIVDDAPVVGADTALIAEGGMAASGSVSGNDRIGADGGGLVRAASVNVAGNVDETFDSGGNLVVAGQYGVLTLKADGSYSYARNAGSPNGVSDVFSYTLRDGDGDSVSATLTINFAGSAPEPITPTPFTLPTSQTPTTTFNGTEADDTLTGTSGRDKLDGKLGADAMTGGAGDDTYVVDNAGDVVTEAAAGGVDTVQTTVKTYTLAANVENVTLTGSRQTVTGNELDNIIISNNTINVINGGGGNDILIAGRDRDTLTGGSGNDIFTYRDAPWNSTIITDFKVGEDLIDLRGMVSKFGYTGPNPTADGWLKIDTDSAGNARIWFDPDGAGSSYSWMHTITVQGVAAANLRLGSDVLFREAPADSLPALSDLATQAQFGDVVAYEYYLPNGRLADAAKVTSTGSFKVSSLDGVGSLTVDGRAIITNGVFTAVSFATPLGNTISFTGYNATTGVVSYSYTITGPTAVTSNRWEEYQLVLTDSDGDVARDTLWAHIVDDRAAAEDDVDYVAVDSTEPATGNVLTDASAGDVGDKDAGADKFGADGGQISRLASANVPANAMSAPDGSGAFVVNGQYGVLTLHLDGSYSYVRTQNAPAGVTDVFTYTIRDGDGDTDTASLTIGIGVTPSVGPELFTLPASQNPTTTFNGTDSGDTLTGTSGHDRLDGKLGADAMSGGAGDDTYIVDNAGDAVTEAAGGGVDTVQTSVRTYTLGANVENVKLTGSRQTVTGNELDNIIISNNTINVLNGGAGNDILVAGRDRDTLTGGSGNDIFDFREAPWNRTIITDFTEGQDIIDMRGMFSKAGYTGSDPVADGWLKIEDDGMGNARVLFDPDGGGSTYGWWAVTTVNSTAAMNLHAGIDWYFQ